MFTGIVAATGRVFEIIMQKDSYRLGLTTIFNDLEVGESIAVNGVCLTLLPDSTPTKMWFDVSQETLAVTNLNILTIGAIVNLERAMLASMRFGGHYVTGHVDKTAKLISIEHLPDDYTALQVGGFNVQENLYLLHKGSITVNGVSLTINAVTHTAHDVTIQLLLVPHTLSQTNLGQCVVNDYVNIEFDYFTRIVAHQLRIMHNDSGI